jgi:C4-dicarboxylate transporter DctM subunit
LARLVEFLYCFNISSMAKQASMRDTFRYVLPFLASDVLRIGLVMMVPSIALVALRVF